VGFSGVLGVRAGWSNLTKAHAPAMKLSIIIINYTRGPPVPGDTAIGLGRRLVGAAIMYSQMRLREQTILPVWINNRVRSEAAAYRRSRILWRFAAISRPSVIRALLVTFNACHC
jgi:hypothetical protein